MSLLLDTHVLFWWTTNNAKLSDTARQMIADHDGPCLVSAASVYELGNKVRLGKMDAARELVERLDAMMTLHRFTALPISFAHAKLAGELAGEHRDPFDRLLAAQAIVEDMPVVTIDAQIAELGARVVW